MNQVNSNRLLNGYNMLQNNQNQFMNNNPFLVNNINNLNMLQNQQNANMQKIREMQQIKQIEKINQLESVDNEKIRESVIKPIKIEISNQEKERIKQELRQLESNYKVNKENTNEQLQKLWKERTNQPYKNIIKNEDYKKNIKNRDDLIVHRVTLLDKDGKVAEKNYTDLKNKIETHDKELKVIYSTDHKNEHLKDFEYKQIYKYRMKFDPKDHDKLKVDQIKYYKNEQKKLEENKKKYDDLIDSLVNEGIFDENELKSLKTEQVEIKKEEPIIDKKQEYLKRQGKI